MRRILIIVIKGYQYGISPMIGPHCRFIPTCSEYTVEAVTRFGAVYGSWLGIKRVLKCHPWHPGGIDPVPQRPERLRE